jgi:hypothetical protein
VASEFYLQMSLVAFALGVVILALFWLGRIQDDDLKPL